MTCGEIPRDGQTLRSSSPRSSRTAIFLDGSAIRNRKTATGKPRDGKVRAANRISPDGSDPIAWPVAIRQFRLFFGRQRGSSQNRWQYSNDNDRISRSFIAREGVPFDRAIVQRFSRFACLVGTETDFFKGKRMTRTPLIPAIWLALILPAVAADWPQFRGPGGLGTAPDGTVPETWSAESNIAWKTELPGPGSSSPIVVGQKVLLTCYSGYGLSKEDAGNRDNLKLHVVCLDRSTGKLLWKTDVRPALPEEKYVSFVNLHGYASSTPVSDGQRVYVFFGKSGMHAFDLDGKPLWQASVGTGSHGFGSASSPVLYKDLVIVCASVESGALVALKKSDGTRVWSAREITGGYNTPVLVSLPGGRDELVLSDGGPRNAGGGSVRAFHPQTGEEIWTCQGLKSPVPYVCASIVAHEGVVYAVGVQMAMAVRAGGQGDVTQSHVVWTIRGGSKVSSPVYHDGHLYWTDRDGQITCVTADKGTQIYSRTRLLPQPGLIYASPIVCSEKLYFVSREVGTYVLEAKPQFRLLAHNQIANDPSVFNGSLAVSDGQFLLRSDRALYCVGKTP